jgi:hypothetical protein
MADFARMLGSFAGSVCIGANSEKKRLSEGRFGLKSALLRDVIDIMNALRDPSFAPQGLRYAYQ